MNIQWAYVDEKKGVVIEWEVKTIREKIYNEPYPWPIYYKGGIMFLDAANASGASSGVSGSGTGFGGSMARFGIKDKALYIVDQNALKVFDISNKTNPIKVTDFYPGWNIENDVPFRDNMFLGTTTGMIYMISQSRWFQRQGSSSTMPGAVDPVIVDDTLAYVTLRSGTTCGGSSETALMLSIFKKIKLPNIAGNILQ